MRVRVRVRVGWGGGGSMWGGMTPTYSASAAQAATAALMGKLRVTAGPAGALAGQMALAVTLSSALFPLVVLAAAALGPRLAGGLRK